LGSLALAPTQFYLGTHQPHWLGLTDAPLFVSRRRLVTYKTLPRAKGSWALDSGGFSELSLFGEWTIDAKQYAGEVRRFRDEIGGLDWAAVQDWMCEPWIIEKTGRTVVEHQGLTVRNYLNLLDIAPDLPWVPVVQGWTIDEYLDHMEMYEGIGIRLASLPRVGVGSVCRRQNTDSAEFIIRRLAGEGLKLHGFGFKTQGLKRLGGVLASADSMAWSFEARRQQRSICGSTTHKNCANCIHYALTWRERLLGNARMVA
jgi:hypothetical protein